MQPTKILVADDEPNLRRVLTALLRREGHDVVQAATGLEAIERLADADVVITDLRMPGADGMEVPDLIEEISLSRHCALGSTESGPESDTGPNRSL